MTAAPLARGRRVHLRHPRASDREAFLKAVRASRALHRPWVSPPSTPEAFAELVRSARADTTRRLLIVRNDDGSFAGVINVTQIFYGPFRSANLGYYALRPHAGQGLMREGMRLALRHAFGDLGLHRVQAAVQPDNERSLALLRACGFTHEGYARRYLKIGGRWRDHELWAILAEDPRTRGQNAAGAVATALGPRDQTK